MRRGLSADAVDGEVAARDERRRDEQRRRGREVAGNLDLAEPQRARAARRSPTSAAAGPARRLPRASARCGRASAPARRLSSRRRGQARRAGSPTSPARSRPAARSRSAQRRRSPSIDQRRVAVGRLDVARPCCAAARRRAPSARRQRLVAGQLEAARRWPASDARQEPHERARVRAVDGAGSQTAQPDAVDDELVVARSPRPRRRARAPRRSSPRVSPARPKPRTCVSPSRDRAEQHCAVRDGLVPGHGDVADDGCGRLDAHRYPIVRPMRDTSARISAAKSGKSASESAAARRRAPPRAAGASRR